MARPRTTSDPIVFRIDLDLWPVLVARAERQGRTIPEYLRAQVERSLGGGKSPGENPATSKAAAAPERVQRDPIPKAKWKS